MPGSANTMSLPPSGEALMRTRITRGAPPETVADVPHTG